jgi:hypothetical protein
MKLRLAAAFCVLLATSVAASAAGVTGEPTASTSPGSSDVVGLDAGVAAAGAAGNGTAHSILQYAKDRPAQAVAAALVTAAAVHNRDKIASLFRKQPSWHEIAEKDPELKQDLEMVQKLKQELLEYGFMQRLPALMHVRNAVKREAVESSGHSKRYLNHMVAYLERTINTMVDIQRLRASWTDNHESEKRHVRIIDPSSLYVLEASINAELTQRKSEISESGGDKAICDEKVAIYEEAIADSEFRYRTLKELSDALKSHGLDHISRQADSPNFAKLYENAAVFIYEWCAAKSDPKQIPDWHQGALGDVLRDVRKMAALLLQPQVQDAAPSTLQFFEVVRGLDRSLKQATTLIPHMVHEDHWPDHQRIGQSIDHFSSRQNFLYHVANGQRTAERLFCRSISGIRKTRAVKHCHNRR